MVAAPVTAAPALQSSKNISPNHESCIERPVHGAPGQAQLG